MALYEPWFIIGACSIVYCMGTVVYFDFDYMMCATLHQFQGNLLQQWNDGKPSMVIGQISIVFRDFCLNYHELKIQTKFLFDPQFVIGTNERSDTTAQIAYWRETRTIELCSIFLPNIWILKCWQHFFSCAYFVYNYSFFRNILRKLRKT